jgi:hypothetical protein
MKRQPSKEPALSLAICSYHGLLFGSILAQVSSLIMQLNGVLLLSICTSLHTLVFSQTYLILNKSIKKISTCKISIKMLQTPKRYSMIDLVILIQYYVYRYLFCKLDQTCA